MDWSQENKNVVNPPRTVKILCAELLKKKAESINKQMCENYENYKKNVTSMAVVSDAVEDETSEVQTNTKDDEIVEVDKTQALEDETSEVQTNTNDDEIVEVDKTDAVGDEPFDTVTLENGLEETKEDGMTDPDMNSDYNDSDDDSMTSDDKEYHEYLEKQEKYYQNLTSEQKQSYDTLDEQQKSLTMDVHLDPDTWQHMKTLCKC